jgi:lysozyme
VAAALVLLAAPMSGCNSDDPRPAPSTASPTSTEATTPPTPATSASTPTAAEPTTTRPPRRRPALRGIDASHHQGAIDWAAVARSGHRFAYLKASEGSTFTDPAFADNRVAASAAGLRVGGYHYFSLCTSGAEQATHFLDVLAGGPARGPRPLPPAIDLELAGSCDTPPSADDLLAEVRTFLRAVERGTGQELVVYLYPEFEARYGFADELADHRQWVRSLDGRPDRAWWMWQRSASATVPGIDGPADVNLMK